MAAARAAARIALAVAYPVAIYVALIWLEPRIVAAGLAALLLLRWGRAFWPLQKLSRTSHAILAGLLLLCIGALVSNDEAILRLYPAAVSAAFLAVFALSLFHPPTVVERIARLRTPELPAAAVLYTRQVTRLWCAFFVLNGAIAAWTAFWASREVWALYNGFISYLAMGCLFAGEWLVRRRLFPEAR
jgi:uncharacterized membrane protein